MNISDGGRRRFEDNEHTLRIYPGTISEGTIYCPVPARKNTTAAEVIDTLINKLHLDKTKCYVLAEVKEFGGEEWILNPTDCPVQRMMLWPRMALENRLSGEDYRFLLREKNLDGSIHYGSLQSWLRVTEERRRMMERGFLPQPQQKDFDDLCSLPDLNEKTLLENLRNRFKHEKIYTYVGSILIVINPFKFLPIYNPKYVKMYDNHQLGKLEPHIYAVADVAYHAMLQRKKNQCIVISGESGSGKTQSTNFLIHHLTALSQKGFASGVEQIILGAGPVLEAFGNAKTAHNNNSSRFGKFIQVNYQETGTVLGAYVEKYLLEKSRLVYQEHNERNYHVFYYLLAGASEEERLAFHLKQPEEYHYLNQITKKPLRQSWDDYCYDYEPNCFSVEGEDLRHDFERLQLAMEMVGFLPKTRRQIFSLLSAILHLGNICYKKKTYRDDSIDICNPEVLPVVSELLEVKEEMLFEALVTRKTVTVGEKLILPYKLAEAVTVRNSMAKSLYSALFDWIVFRINHALLNSKDLERNTKTLSIGVLDIFGFEDYENNSFEQFCINFANERLQHYFNQHIFKLEQEEYRTEGISWHNIDYIDNTCCINLISKKPTGLLHLLDEESNFPQATNQTLLDKFKHQHEENSYIEFPAVMEPAFTIKHYAGKVKYGVKDFREKNTDHMRPDIVALLRSSKNAFISGMIGIDPVAVFRWAVLRAFFRAIVAFREAGKRHIQRKTGHDDTAPCAVLKSMDSFSFLQHPVHQRSLEILQRCKEEKYNITRKNPRTPLSDLQGMNTLNEKNQHDTFDIAWNVRTGIHHSKLPSSTSLRDKDGIFANSASSKLLERAHGILTRNKNFKSKPALPKHLLEVNSLKHLTRLTLQDRITKSLLHLHKKKKPPSISAQFQASLSKLMETLDQAEPYFVKCIRSNAEKLPLRFNDALVLRQLRYTGMLETVRIRQSGYSSKYSFQDFVSHFHVLLPRNTIPSKLNIEDFFRKINLNPDNYQVGKTMVFLKEQGRQNLQDLLHQEVLRRIILLQRWFRALLCRQHFLHLKQASIIIQQFWRNYLNKKQVRDVAVQKDALVMASAATLLQASWRAHLERQRYLELRAAVIIIQQKWREIYRRRHMAATCIQARWKGYRENKRYQEQKKKIILLQSTCRGFRARQSVNNEALNKRNPQVPKQDEPAGKPVKLVGPGQQEQVARPAHKKKARMARTRSDFLTRGTFADGEGDTEEDDYDDIIEPLLSLDQASHSELGPASSLGQASHSDSEMTSQRFSSVDEQVKLHKAMSQGEITKLTVRQKSSDSDIRPQRAKMRFWAKGKQGEKKTTRVKPVIRSEVSAIFAGSDVIPSHQFPDELTHYNPTPPLSPELPGSCQKEFKENKEPSPKTKRKRSVKISNVALDSMHWQNDSVQIITSTSDLKSMDEFLLKKMHDLDNEDSKKDTLVDVVFKKALKEFRQNIFSFYSSALAMDDGKSIRYKDLYALFEQILEKTMRLEQRDWSESPVRVWVNTFKVFLDEYMNDFKTSDSTATKVPKTERKKRRKKETDLVEEHNGHIFKATQYSIPTYCEYCSSLIWIMDRASVCKLCKYACHKKCCLKTTAKCSKKYDPELSSRQFGVELSRLTSEDRTVPLVVEKLINYIEMHGLYTEGIYRKSGSTNKIKELRQGLDTDAENVNLDDYNIHVIASVFKQWLRDLPNPLMTFELYEEFLRAMGLQERKETIRGVYSVIDQLSRTHLNTLERLIFHLVRIALQEETNRMSANALAIVFAPCILRCPDTTDPLQSVQDISKTTTCVELIVVEQMNKYKARLKDISSLEFAENKAKTRLSLIRRSMKPVLIAVRFMSITRSSVSGKGRVHRGNYPSPSSPVTVRLPSVSDVPEETSAIEAATETDITEQQQAAMQQEERVLTEQIENLQKEKEELTFEMLVLEPRASDDETLESEASIGTADSSENLNMESEGATSGRSERSLALSSLKAPGKPEPSSKLRKQLKKQQDSLDSVDSSISSYLSNTALSHGTRKRFQIYSKSPFYRAASAGEALGLEGPLGQTRPLEERPQFISRGTFNPEKGKQKLKNVKNSPQKTKETPEGTVMSGRRKPVDPDCSSTQQLALFGNNEFMV
ncbi:unconventional myosin-IXa isoform X8 [Ictidomys tridecemlineatus]|uniref:unconventional myosin-IXa isoform X7 n=1 Tax=Ictidomys tridecemlineatus TaxID=43179 RepID=UPI001A9DE3E9|nr:unconventional myosin-IXa isoform X7 [Ictidomys tridecemlineatus]